ncbi:MAG TPA: caspase family protein [Kofleriaceae bacterium]|nr:caspase family protein [Kofleriaceae bacterium]
MMRGVAVCCGFNGYEGRPLDRAVNDATILYARLTESGMFNAAPDLIGKGEVFTQRTPASAILAALRRASASTADLVWFSFSGHSAVSCDGELRLLLPGWRRDASEAEQQTYSIGAHELENVLRSRIPGKKFVVVLDACHSGAFGHGAVTRDIGAFGFIRPLEATIASAGAVVISSCTKDQVALDGHAESRDLNGAFTAAVIRVLEDHAREKTPLTVLRLFLAARDRIKNGQVPTLYANGLTSDFLVLGAPSNANTADGVVELSAEVPAKIKSKLTTFLDSLIQIHRRKRVGLVHAERRLESLAAEFYRYGDDTFVVPGHSSHVTEAFDSARSSIIGCTVPRRVDGECRGGVGLLAANPELVVGHGGRVVRFFFVPDDAGTRDPAVLDLVRDELRAGAVVVVVNVHSFGPTVMQWVFHDPRPDDMTAIECAFIDGKVFLKDHVGAGGECKVEIDQRSTRCRIEYKALLRPFVNSGSGELLRASLGSDGDEVVLAPLGTEDLGELRQQLDADLTGA